MSYVSPLRSVIAVCFLLYAGATSLAQVLPNERGTDWKLAGLRDSSPVPSRFIDFTQFGGKADEVTPNDDAFAQVLNSLQGESAILFFPKGKYYFTRPLNLPSGLIIQGAGSDSTKLIFKLTQEDNLIKINGTQGSETAEVTADLKKDAFSIPVSDAGAFRAGDYIRVSDNDAVLVASDWAKGHTGQIARIQRIEGNTIHLSSPLRRNYSLDKNPSIQRLIPARHTGIENIGIIRLDKTDEQTSNIQFNYAAECWVKCVESQYSNYAHVEISNSTNVDISGSYFHDAFSYGGGGEGYGIALQYTSGECLVQKSIFDHLRHSILLQAGANGNVIAYNFSQNPYWTEPFLPSASAGEIVLHGNYPYANLFEGNSVQNIVIDNSHGMNGMYNTFFRNRAAGYGIVVTDKKAENQSFIGNEITNSRLGSLLLMGTGHLQYGNNKNGTISPEGTSVLMEKSLYLTETPEYYKKRSEWPPVGAPNNLNAHAIEAEGFFREGYLTPCLVPETNDTFGSVDTTHGPIDTTSSIKQNHYGGDLVKLYPNPATSYVTIQTPQSSSMNIREVRIDALTGQELVVYKGQGKIDVSHLPPAVYLVLIDLSNGDRVMKKLVKAAN
jgi:hypothetical protein